MEMTYLKMLSALEMSGFYAAGKGLERYHNWRHREREYITVTYYRGKVWIMRSPDQSIEIKDDLDIPVALDLLTGG